MVPLVRPLVRRWVPFLSVPRPLLWSTPKEIRLKSFWPQPLPFAFFQNWHFHLDIRKACRTLCSGPSNMFDGVHRSNTTNPVCPSLLVQQSSGEPTVCCTFGSAGGGRAHCPQRAASEVGPDSRGQTEWSPFERASSIAEQASENEDIHPRNEYHQHDEAVGSVHLRGRCQRG